MGEERAGAPETTGGFPVAVAPILILPVSFHLWAERRGTSAVTRCTPARGDDVEKLFVPAGDPDTRSAEHGRLL